MKSIAFLELIFLPAIFVGVSVPLFHAGDITDSYRLSGERLVSLSSTTTQIGMHSLALFWASRLWCCRSGRYICDCRERRSAKGVEKLSTLTLRWCNWVPTAYTTATWGKELMVLLLL